MADGASGRAPVSSRPSETALVDEFMQRIAGIDLDNGPNEYLQTEENEETVGFTFPTANVLRLVRSVADERVRVSRKSRCVFQAALLEFAAVLASEAGENGKKTAGPVDGEDIAKAMDRLGFGHYAGTVRAFLSHGDYRGVFHHGAE